MIVFLLLFAVETTADEEYKRDKFGTVLFTEADNWRVCWSDEHIALLTSRMFFEDILPADSVFNIEDDRFILALVDYFQMVVATAKLSTEGKAKHILLTSLSDCLGGYLHHVALPLARYAYYCGNIKYETIEKMYELYDELKQFLRTDGKFWAPPITDFRKFKIEVLPLPAVTEESTGQPCEEIIYYESNGDNATQLYIPMPFFDSNEKPHAIAVPFRNSSLRNIQGRGASFIIVKFFMGAVACLAYKKADRSSMHKFYRDLDSWIDNYVMNHLYEDRFYAAFGGIYRIRETLAKNEKECPGCQHAGPYQLIRTDIAISMTATAAPTTFEPLVKSVKSNKNSHFSKRSCNTCKVHGSVARYEEGPSFWDDDVERKEKRVLKWAMPWSKQWTWDAEHTKYFILIIILIVVVLIWFCVGIFYLCYRMHRKRKCEPPPPEVERKPSPIVVRPSCTDAASCTAEIFPDAIECRMTHSVANPVPVKVSKMEVPCTDKSSQKSSKHMKYVRKTMQSKCQCNPKASHEPICDATSDSANRIGKSVVYGYEYYNTTDTSVTDTTDFATTPSIRSAKRSRKSISSLKSKFRDGPRERPGAMDSCFEK